MPVPFYTNLQRNAPRKHPGNRCARPFYPGYAWAADSSTMITFDHGKYDGYIFDCDGTLADTMPLHYQAWSETLDAKLGRKSDFTESMFYHFGGMPARQIVERLNRDFGYSFNPEEFAHEKEMRFVELLPGIGPVQEVIDVLNRLGPDAK